MESSEGPPTRRRVRPGAVIAGLAAVGVLGMWAWVFVFHLGGTWRDNQPGQLDDRTFPVAADPVCAAAMSEFAALPPAWATTTNTDRAAAVADSVAIFEAMVERLRQLPAGSETTKVDEWIADWDTYVADRQDYAQRLAQDPTARFYVTQSNRDRRQITLAIDRFATTNAMPSCATPADLS